MEMDIYKKGTNRMTLESPDGSENESEFKSILNNLESGITCSSN